jgi:hypothetical protein
LLGLDVGSKTTHPNSITSLGFFKDDDHLPIAAIYRKLERRGAAPVGNIHVGAALTTARKVSVWFLPPSPSTIDSISAVHCKLLT